MSGIRGHHCPTCQSEGPAHLAHVVPGDAAVGAQVRPGEPRQVQLHLGHLVRHPDLHLHPAAWAQQSTLQTAIVTVHSPEDMVSWLLYVQKFSEGGKASVLHFKVTLAPSCTLLTPVSPLSTTGGTANTEPGEGSSLARCGPTLHAQVHPLADGGRHPVAGDAEVGGGLGPGHALEGEGGAAHARHWNQVDNSRQRSVAWENTFFTIFIINVFAILASPQQLRLRVAAGLAGEVDPLGLADDEVVGGPAVDDEGWHLDL